MPNFSVNSPRPLVCRVFVITPVSNMALSIMGGEYGEPRALPPNPEDDVLCELNADFRQSKSELIQRFLKDQEDLNQRFAEYALNSDEGKGSDSARLGSPVHLPSCYPTLPGGFRGGSGGAKREAAGEVFDVLQDIEDKGMLDNLSITSAVNSSSDAPSLSDGGDPASYEDLDEEKDYDENWNVNPQPPPCLYDDQYYDQYSQEAGSLLNRALSAESNQSVPSIDGAPQPRRSKKNKEGTPTRKVKKFLVKKNVRPQTAVGVRALPDTDDVLCANTSDCLSLRPKPISAGTPTFRLHDSMSLGTKLKKISWTEGSDDHPELGRLSISASMHKMHQRSHTPGGRLKSFSSPRFTANPLGSLRGSGHGGRHNTNNEADCHLRNNLKSTELRELRPEPFQSGTPLSRPDSTTSNRSLISVDFGHDQLSGFGPRRTPSSGIHPQPLMRSSVYSAERGGRLVMTPSLADVKGKKRPIAVLKLPPLDSSVVNRAIGVAANIDPSGHQPSLVSPATAKSNTVATPSAI